MGGQWRGVLEMKTSTDEILTLAKNKKVLDKNFLSEEKAFVSPDEVPEEVKDIYEKREQVRQEKDWAEADRLRREVEKLGYEFIDTPEGVKIKY